ncbi:MAG: hypothetical protein AB2556_21310 [Candidatus Thiodiazotropha sp.]
MYSILEASGKNIKKAKGVRKATVRKRIRHEQFKEALFEKRTCRHGMDVLWSERHRIYGKHFNKVSLSPFDSTRRIAENGVDTLAYGHKDIRGAVAANGDDGVGIVGSFTDAEIEAYIEELFGV